MTALAVVAAQVLLVSGPSIDGQIFGEALAAGKMVYQKSTDLKWYMAQCDGTAEEAGSGNLGMALVTADAAGARGSIAMPGAVVKVAASGLTVAVPHFVGNAAGALEPYGDLGSTDKVVPCALVVSATEVLLGRMYHSGAVLA